MDLTGLHNLALIMHRQPFSIISQLDGFFRETHLGKNGSLASDPYAGGTLNAV
jgi:hypothetical protein